MDESMLTVIMPSALENLFPGNVTELMPGSPFWVVQRQGLAALVAILDNPLHARMTAGCAVAVPPSSALFQTLSDLNRNLMVGRIYAEEVNESNVNVVAQENVFADALSMDHPPSLADLLTRFRTLATEAQRAAQVILTQVGGRPCTPSDVVALLG